MASGLDSCPMHSVARLGFGVLLMTFRHPPTFERGMSFALICRSMSWIAGVELWTRVEILICTCVRMLTHVCISSRVRVYTSDFCFEVFFSFCVVIIPGP